MAIRTDSVRRRRILLSFVLAALPSSVGGQRLLSTADLPSLAGPPPTHRLQYGTDPLQFGNLRLPRGNGPHPVVIFIHGGCWLSAFNITHAGSLEQAVADSGYAVWSIEYRRVGDPGGGWPGTFTDIGAAADHLRELAPKHALDLNRVVAVGHSAGGQFALWLAARSKIASNSELHVPRPLPIKAVLGLAPAPDLEDLHKRAVCGNVIDRLMGGSPADRAERYNAASPMRLSPIGVPQSLVVGAKDESWAPIGRAYYQHAVASGDRQIKLVEAAESGHFEVIAPKSSTWSTVIESLRTLFAGR
jgi:acetyl esterase/lipase